MFFYHLYYTASVNSFTDTKPLISSSIMNTRRCSNTQDKLTASHSERDTVIGMSLSV